MRVASIAAFPSFGEESADAKAWRMPENRTRNAEENGRIVRHAATEYQG